MRLLLMSILLILITGCTTVSSTPQQAGLRQEIIVWPPSPCDRPY